MRFFKALFVTIFLGLASPAVMACGTYHPYCNILIMTEATATPENYIPGEDTVTIDVDLFEFANWYWTNPSAFALPSVFVQIGDRWLEAQLVDYELSPVNWYGYGYYWWYTQYASFSYRVEWDGKDANGALVTEPRLAEISAYAGMSQAYTGIALFPQVSDVGKDDGRNCKPAGEVSPQIGDPCNLTTGNTYREERDYQNGDGSLNFTRSYNSRQSDRDYGLGKGWIAPGLRHLELREGGLVVREADGRGEPVRDKAGTWEADADSHLRLESTADGFLLHRDNGSRDRYDSQGRLRSAFDPQGRETRYEYDSQNHLNAVITPDGYRLAFEYDTQGRLTTLLTPAGRQISYAYDDEGNLDAVTYPDATSRYYHYEDSRFPGKLTGVTDERGIRIASYAYDDAGRAILSTHALREDGEFHDAYTLAYDSDTQTTVTDGLDNAIAYTFEHNLGVRNLIERQHGADGKVITQVFDARNNLISRTDEEGGTTSLEYNADNQLIRKVEAEGLAQARITEYTYLAPELDRPSAVRTASVVPGQWAETIIEYDEHDNPTSVTRRGWRPDGSAVERTRTMVYDAHSRLVQIDGPRTDTADITTLAYYTCNTGRECGQLRSVNNALGHATHFNAYDADGRLLQTTGPNGVVTVYEYDARGRLSRLEQRAPDGEVRTVHNQYDASGNLVSVRLPDGVTLSYHYDGSGLLSSVSDNGGRRIEYRYDVKGNRHTERLIDPDATLVRTIEYAHNLRDQLIQVTAAGSITTQLRDALGRLQQQTDANGHTSSHEYDALGRLTETLDALGGRSGNGYDTAGNLTRVEAANGAMTDYRYDDLGNRLEELSPDRGRIAYTYNTAGEMTTVTDARGISASYHYDALGRLLTVDWPGTENDLSYRYDDCPNGVGRLCGSTDASGTLAYSYDAFGNRLTETRSLGGQSYVTAYAYDAVGRVIRMRYPDGREVNFERDQLGQISAVITAVEGNAVSLASAISYQVDGAITQLSYGNGLAETRHYDLLGRLSEWWLGAEVRHYHYDGVGNLIARESESFTDSFSYDALDRLSLESTLAGDLGYSYDGNGNRLTQQEGPAILAYDYAAVSNRLIARAGNFITLDASGNTVDDGRLRYTYSASGRLAAVHEGNTLLASYRYDALGRRITKTNANGSLHYHYDGAGHLILETRADGQALRSYVWLDDRPLAQIDWKMGQGNGKAKGVVSGKANPPASDNAWTEVVTWLHTDHLNTPRLGSNDQGEIVWRWEGKAFGASPPNEDTDGDGKMVVINLRFPGQYYDAETGRHYNYFRDYDPGTGRYIQSDPIGLAGGLNTYSYVGSNPINRLDPFGLIEYYGNWCGPNWTGGYSEPWDNLTDEQQKHALLPIDAADSCCESHDKCHARCREDFTCDSDGRAECYKTCDRELYGCSKNSGVKNFRVQRMERYMKNSTPGAGPNNPVWCGCQ